MARNRQHGQRKKRKSRIESSQCKAGKRHWLDFLHVAMCILNELCYNKFRVISLRQAGIYNKRQQTADSL